MKLSNASEMIEARRQASFRAIVNANVKAASTERERLVGETMVFLGKFPGLSTRQVKELTLLRQANGNEDPRVVPFSDVTTPDGLADAVDTFYHTNDFLVLKKEQELPKHEEALSMDI